MAVILSRSVEGMSERIGRVGRVLEGWARLRSVDVGSVVGGVVVVVVELVVVVVVGTGRTGDLDFDLGSDFGLGCSLDGPRLIL